MRLAVSALALAALAASGCKPRGAASPDLQQKAQQSADPRVRDYYAAEDSAPLWTDGEQATEAADALLQRLCGAVADGLNPANYGLDSLQALRNRLATSPTPATLAAFEVQATEAFVRFAKDLGRGRVDARALGAEWHLKGDTLQEARALTALRTHGLAAALDSLSQHGNGYEPLRQAVARYQQVVAAGGWATLPTRAGDEALRQRLALEGDLDSTAADSAAAPTATAASGAAASVADGLRAFQRRHGLRATGTLNDSTRAALNVPAEVRLAVLEANLERLRWMPSSFGPTYVSVNLPAFHLEAWENGRKVMEMPVIVGSEAHSTPAFADTMRYLAFAPYWNVPASIATRTLAGKSAGFYQSGGYEVLRGNTVVSASEATRANLEAQRVRLRQKPGPKNSLGNVKFMFPNRHAIYLHDTPATELFSRQNRTLSSGCIRVSQPDSLALWALGPNGGWNAARVDSAMAGTKEQRVDLARQIPVYLVYQTAWVDSSGAVHFRPDVYGHDARLLAAMNGAPGATPSPISSDSTRTDSARTGTPAARAAANADSTGTGSDTLAAPRILAAAPETLTLRRLAALPAACQASPAR